MPDTDRVTEEGAESGERESTPGPCGLDFWSFVELANRRLSQEYGFEHQLATRLLLTLNRASGTVTYDLEAAVHRPRGRSWAAFKLMFVVWLAGPLEPSSAARIAGMSRAAVSNLARGLRDDGLLDQYPDERDGRSVRLSLSDAGHRDMVEVFREHNEREHGWASALTEEEQRILIMLLEKLISARRQFDIRGRN
jgi:DNA-binding MarR family transcriptional regulator